MNLRWIGYGIEQTQKQSRLPYASGWIEKQLTAALLFTFVYGGAIAAGLWWVWVTAGRPFHPGWIIAPLALMTADWTEHLIHLLQFHNHMPSNEARLETLVMHIPATPQWSKSGSPWVCM